MLAIHFEESRGSRVSEVADQYLTRYRCQLLWVGPRIDGAPTRRRVQDMLQLS